jgi:hypothetical protein
VKTEDWPFDQPPNCAVITLKAIVAGEMPILFVSHDERDHGWQFLSGDPVSKEDASVVALREIVELDPSILKLADLPAGWVATRRSAYAGWEKNACI